MNRNIKYILVLLIINLLMLITINVTLKDKITNKEAYFQEISKMQNNKNTESNSGYSEILNSLKDNNINILGFKDINGKNVSVKVEIINNVDNLNNFIRKIENKSNLSRINNIEIRKDNNENNYRSKMDIEFIKSK